MSEQFRVLVLLKPSETQIALDRVAEFARFMPNIEVVAMRVIHEFNEVTKDSIQQTTNREILKIRDRYPSIKNFSVKIVFSTKVPIAFNEEAASGNYNLAVISANKRNTIKDLFVSTIDSNIMRAIKIPLLVVKASNTSIVRDNAIIIAIDFEEAKHEQDLDDILLEKATAFAQRFNGQIHVVNCVSPLNRGYMSAKTSMGNVLGKNTTRLSIHHQIMYEFAKKHGISIENCHVLEGRVDEEIPRLAQSLNARMICMGIASEEGLLGSINSTASELVLEQTKSDLFIINKSTV